MQDDITQSVVKELRAALLGESEASAASASVRAEVQAAAAGRTDDPALLVPDYLRPSYAEDRG